MVRDDNYYTVLRWFTSKLGLTGAELKIFAIIYSFSQDGINHFCGNQSYLAEFAEITRPTANIAIRKLLEKGYIKKQDVINNVEYYVDLEKVEACRNSNTGVLEDLTGVLENLTGGVRKSNTEVLENLTGGVRKSNTEVLENLTGGVRKSNTEVLENLTGGVRKSNTYNNYHNNINNNYNNSSMLNKIAEYWNKSFAETSVKQIKKITIDSIRAKNLVARLKEYGYDQIILAIDNVKKSDFLCGKNQRGWVASFDWFIKPNNFIKIIEGQYENNNSNKTSDIDSTYDIDEISRKAMYNTDYDI